MPETNPADSETVADHETIEADGDAVPSVFELLGHALVAAHQSATATAAQLNVALAAYRIVEAQRDSLGPDEADALRHLLGRSSDALKRILHRDTGAGSVVPPTFNSRRPPTESAESRGGE